MKKLSLFFALSFISYAVLLPAMPYVTARGWADALALLSAGCGAYQLLYIIFLRKKDNVSLGRSIANWFLCAFSLILICSVLYLAKTFVFGYTQYAFMGGAIATYYGFEAWESDLGAVILLPYMAVSVVYIAAYAIVNKKLK